MFHAEKWTILSQGGFGSNGQNGGDGKKGRDGKSGATKWSKSNFESEFPTMSRWKGSNSTSAVTTTLRTLERILPHENRDYGRYVSPGGRKSFFIEGTPNNGGTITASFEDGSRRHSVVLCKGTFISLNGYLYIERLDLFFKIIQVEGVKPVKKEERVAKEAKVGKGDTVAPS